jgi:hypothetical protein
VDVFEAARQSFFAGAHGNAAASPHQIFTQVKCYDGPLVDSRSTQTDRIASAKAELAAVR